MRPHTLSTAPVAALAVASSSPAITLAQGPDVGPVAEAVGSPAARVGAPPQAPEPVKAAVEDAVKPAATATRINRSRTSPAAAAMRGGAEPSQDVDGTRVVTDGGLGSFAVGRRDGGVEDGAWADVARGTAATREPASVVRPPTAAPPVIAVVADLPRFSQAAPARVAPSTAADPLDVALLRALNRRPTGSLLASDATRSLLPGARRPVPSARRAPGEQQAATGGTSAAAAFAPPPSGVAFALLAATLAGAAAIFSVLMTPPARSGPVPFISLLERPG